MERCDTDGVWNGAIKTNGSFESLLGIDIIDITRHQRVFYMHLRADLLYITVAICLLILTLSYDSEFVMYV